jgi:hypothetical protein
MPIVLRPGRNATLRLAYELMAEDERKAKKSAKKEPEPAEPVKKPTKRQERK